MRSALATKNCFLLTTKEQKILRNLFKKIKILISVLMTLHATDDFESNWDFSFFRNLNF